MRFVLPSTLRRVLRRVCHPIICTIALVTRLFSLKTRKKHDMKERETDRFQSEVIKQGTRPLTNKNRTRLLSCSRIKFDGVVLFSYYRLITLTFHILHGL